MMAKSNKPTQTPYQPPHLCTVHTATIVKSMVWVYMITLHEDLLSKLHSTVAAITDSILLL